jgi:TonB family protein
MPTPPERQPARRGVRTSLGKALARAWEPDRVLKARGVAGYLAQAGENLRTFGRAWQRVAEAYARTGAPGPLDGGSPRIRELAGLPPGPAQDALVDAEVDRQLRKAFSEGHVATVRVVQGPDGALRSVELTVPSRDAEVDREALAAVRRAVASLPAPPPEALAGRDALVTTWEFELEVSITPPVPAVTLEFDEVLGLRDVRVPLDRRIWKRVRLVAIG